MVDPAYERPRSRVIEEYWSLTDRYRAMLKDDLDKLLGLVLYEMREAVDLDARGDDGGREREVQIWQKIEEFAGRMQERRGKLT